jgi:hypothetical protein
MKRFAAALITAVLVSGSGMAGEPKRLFVDPAPQWESDGLATRSEFTSAVVKSCPAIVSLTDSRESADYSVEVFRTPDSGDSAVVYFNGHAAYSFAHSTLGIIAEKVCDYIERENRTVAPVVVTGGNTSSAYDRNVMLAGKYQLPQGTPGQVVFFNFNPGISGVYGVTVYCDGSELVRLKEHRKYSWTAMPGSHECYDKNDAKRHMQPLRIVVNAGETVYVIVQQSGFPIHTEMSLYDIDINSPDFRSLRPVTDR